MTDIDQAAELVAIAHRCVDWDVWGGARAVRYWDALADRCRNACYAGPTLAHWWERLTTQMSLDPPRTTADRARLAELLTSPTAASTLHALRTRTQTVVLTVRVAVDEAKTARTAGTDIQGELL